MGKFSQEIFMSKREEIRKQREAHSRRNKILLLSGIVVFVLLFVGAITLPIIRSNNLAAKNIILPPLDPRPNAKGTAMGDLSAPIVVEMYSDFQCPFCKKFTDQSEQAIITDFIATGKVYFIYRPFTVIGPESDAAALAAYCAADQNNFWQYHDILFANVAGEEVGSFYDARLIAFAEKLGLQMDQFKSCYSSKQHQDQLKADRALGEAAKLKGTPAIYINGVDTPPNQVYAAIKSLLTQ